MRFLPSLLASAAFISLSLAAHADTIFDVNGTTGAGGTFTGTLSIDTVAGTIDGGSITFDDPNYPKADTTPIPYYISGNNGELFALFYDSHSTSNDIAGIAFSGVTSLIGYQGGTICSGTCDVKTDSGYIPSAVSGQINAYETIAGSISLPAVAATPEPSSLILLSTGLLSAVGAARRRFLNR